MRGTIISDEASWTMLHVILSRVLNDGIDEYSFRKGAAPTKLNSIFITGIAISNNFSFSWHKLTTHI